MARIQYQKEASTQPKKPGFLFSHYRKIITSSGMVQCTLGLGFVMTWIFVSSLLYNIEMALGICFLVSGTIAFFCGNFRSLYLIYATMIASIITTLMNIALLIIIVYVVSKPDSFSISNPLFVVFLVYILFGVGFSFLSAKYSFLARKILSVKTRVERELSTDFSSGVTPVTNATMAPQGDVFRRHQQPLPMTRWEGDNANINSNVNADIMLATTSSL